MSGRIHTINCWTKMSTAFRMCYESLARELSLIKSLIKAQIENREHGKYGKKLLRNLGLKLRHGCCVSSPYIPSSSSALALCCSWPTPIPPPPTPTPTPPTPERHHRYNFVRGFHLIRNIRNCKSEFLVKI